MRVKIAVYCILIIFLSQSVLSADEPVVLANGFKEIVDTGISFQWKVEEDTLRIILSAPTEGWIAVGFNPSRVMKDADFKLAYVDGETIYMEDHFGTGLFGHKQDTAIGGSDNFEVLSGKEEMGATTVEFTIPLDSGDEFDTSLMAGDEVKVLLAYGTRDNLSQKHKKRSSIMINL